MSRFGHMWTTTRRALQPFDLHAATHGSLATQGVQSSIGLAIQGFLRFATSWLVGHIGGRAAVGVVQSAISTATLLALLWPTTTGAAASKYIARARGAADVTEMDAVAAHLRRRSVLAGAAVGLAAVPAWVLLDDGDVVGALWVGAFAAAYSGYSFARGLQFGAGQVARATTWDALSAVTGLVALTVALLAGLRGTVLLLPIALSYALYTAAAWPRRAQGAVSRALRRDMDQFVLLGVLGTLASTGFLQIAMIVAKATSGAEEAGEFAAAMVTATPASMLASSLSLVLFPSLAESWGRGDRERFRAQTDQAIRALVLVMVAVFGSLVLCSELVMTTLWRDFDATSLVFPVLLGAILATNIAIASSNALSTRSTRGLRVTSGSSFAGLVIGAAMWLALVPDHGILGVALGYLAGSVVAALIPIVVEWRVGGHSWHLLLLRIAVGVGGIVALFYLERTLNLPVPVQPLIALVFVVLWAVISRRDLHVLPRPAINRKRT